MLVKILLIEEDKITLKQDDVEKTLIMEDYVIPHAKLGVAEIKINESKKVSFIQMQSDDPNKKKNFTDEMVTFETLLSEAHKRFGKRLEIETAIVRDGDKNVMIDFDKKRALFEAEVTIKDEKDSDRCQRFTGTGDAEGITNTLIKPHFIRMAETRAIVRALKLATNNATCSEEEK